MKKNHIQLIVSSILIVVAFFFWILFEKSYTTSSVQELQNKKYYVNIEQLKTKLKFTRSSPNIVIQLDGKDIWEKAVIELVKE